MQKHNISNDRILICPHLGDGGTQRVLTTLANAWSRQGIKVTVITLYQATDCYQLDAEIQRIYCSQSSSHSPASKKKTALQKSISFARNRLYFVVRLFRFERHAGFFLYYMRMLINLRRAIAQSEAPLVITFIAHVNILTILACVGMGKRVIISERNDPARQSLLRVWEILRKYLYRYASVVTANSRSALKTLSVYVPKHKLFFVPNPLTIPSRLSENSTTLPPSPFMLAVGRLHQQKALDVLLHAFSCLPSSLNHWSLVIVGQGEEQASLCHLAQDLGISEKIIWTGQLADPFPYYQNAAFFVQPSRYEGMSNALLEAMACGLAPIVTNTAKGSLELVEEGVSGLIVPVENPSALMDALAQLALAPEFAERLGRQAQKKVLPYKLPQALAQWEQILRC